MSLCKCGCGNEAKPGNNYINGHNSRNRKVSNSTREKQRKSQQKRREDPEDRKRTGIGVRKALEDDLTIKERISIGVRKAYKDDPTIGERISIGICKAREKDPTIVERISIGMSEYWSKPGNSEKQGERMDKRYDDILEREKQSKRMKKRYEDPLEREKIRDGILKYIDNNSEHARNYMVKGGLASMKSQDGKPSSIEFKMRKILEDNDYQFETNKPLLNLCIPDIVFKNEKVIIQCDGDYWHDYPNGLDKDYRQDRILKQNGWQVIRFWEHEINNNIDGCLERFQWETFRRFNT